MKFTPESVDSLRLPPGKKDFIAFDDKLAGFGLRLREGGSRNWIFQYAFGNGQRRRVIGKATALSLKRARQIAAEYHARVQLGQDPAGDKDENEARSGETFEACMRIYLERRRKDPKLRASSYRHIERHLDRNLKALHRLRIDKLDRRAIALELSRFTNESGPVQANRTRSSVVAFLNWCAGEGFIDANPAQFTNKNSEQARDRVLVDRELRTVWQALPDGDYGDIVKLLVLTGQREAEIGGLQWDESDLDRGIITLPPARTKNRRPHTVPLSAPAAAILKAREQDGGRKFVFGAGQKGFSGWSKAKLRLDEQVKIAPFVIHDLRRSVATGMSEIGIAPHVVEAVLNHISGAKAGVAGTYNKSTYEAEKATALARWAEHLMALVEGRESNVASMRRA